MPQENIDALGSRRHTGSGLAGTRPWSINFSAAEQPSPTMLKPMGRRVEKPAPQPGQDSVTLPRELRLPGSLDEAQAWRAQSGLKNTSFVR